MKFSSRREEILAKLAEKEQAVRTEAAIKAQGEMVAEASKVALHADHPRPTTRRELLGSGLATGFACAALPSIFTLAAKTAEAAPNCAKGGASAGAAKTPGYLHVELSGGPALSGNFMFGKQAAGAAFEPLAAAGYATLGLGATQIPGVVQLDSSIKGQFHPASQFLAGMKSVMSPAALAKTAVVGLAGTSADDNANNPLNPIQLNTKVVGNPGALVQIAGNAAARPNTQGRTAALPLGEDPGLAKALVSNEAGLANLVNPGLIAARFGNNTQASIQVAELAHKLTASKLAQFQAKDLNQQVKDLVECGYMGAKDLLTQFTADKLTPSTDTAITGAAFNAIPAATLLGANPGAVNSPNALQAIILGKLLADGLSSAGNIVMAGYDYHGQGRVTEDAKDFQAGQTVGLALEVAHRKGAPLFVAVTADGSTSSGGAGGANNRFDFAADNGSHGSALMIAMGTSKLPETQFLQIGKYADSGAVDTSYATITAGTPANQALAISYNYASFAGKMASFDTLTGSANLFKGQEATYLAFRSKFA